MALKLRPTGLSSPVDKDPPQHASARAISALSARRVLVGDWRAVRVAL